MKKIILSIDGMTCSACSNGLEKYLNKQEGIKNASVNLVMSCANIEYDEKVLSIDKINEFVKKAGFKSLGEFKEIKLERKNKVNNIKFIIFTVLAIILMYVSMGHMIGLPVFDVINMNISPVVYTICLCAFSILFIIYGFDILINGYKNLIHKTPNMDTLVSIGILSSFLFSIYSMILVLKGNHNYVHNLYFETTAMVIYFIKLGRYIEGINRDSTKEAILKLVTITPKNAIVKKNDKEVTVTIDEISKGDIVICKPGEKIAVDGEIIKGQAHIDESFITGESKPVNKSVLDKVIAGSVNYDGYIEYRAQKIGKDSTISEIVKLVVEASNTKAPISKIADKVSGYFVPLVMILAILTFIFYLIFGNTFEDSLITFITVLVVACPCSLGIATPLATIVSEGKCVKNGILIKKSEILENVNKVDTIVFDKTGTLTYGKLKISEIKNYSTMNEDYLLQLVGSIESKVTHPIGKAFTDYMEENKIAVLDITEFENIPGYGVSAKVDNKKVIIGNRKILEENGIENNHIKDEEEISKNGNSIVYVACMDEILAIIGVNDIIRENVKDVISSLNDIKVETIMLTGDNDKTAKKIAKEIGVTNVISEVLPHDKANVIKKLQEDGKFVIMCGDGINDSPALAVSNIGVSVKSGTDIAMDSSDVILVRNDLNGILKLFNVGKRTIKIIKQNLFFAFFYNVLMILVAMGLFKNFQISINPMIASMAMIISSFSVMINTLRLKR